MRSSLGMKLPRNIERTVTAFKEGRAFFLLVQTKKRLALAEENS